MQLYTSERYEYRGRFAKTRFERECLNEYADVFKAVCVDAVYYAFPSMAYLQDMADQTPDDFRFGFKVTDTITIKKFPNLPRFGAKAAMANPDFLNADLFATAFLKPCEKVRDKVGVLMFEFSRFFQRDYEHGRQFVDDLDSFLSKLPSGWPYAVEIRNKAWLKEEYFGCLTRHNVTHVHNAWTHMEGIYAQVRNFNAETTPDRAVARFLLKEGRTYEEAVKLFSPYNRTVEVNPDATQAGAFLIQMGQNKPKKTYIFVNNRMEGNALFTVKSMLDLAGV